MGFHVYNTPNQALKAEKLAEVLSYISEDFAGVVADDWNTEVIKNPTEIVYDEIENPEGNPSTSNYYEYQNSTGYILSKDTTVQDGKKYYEYKNCWVWNKALQNTQITFIGAGINIGYDVPSPKFGESDEEDSGYWVFPNTADEYIYGLDVIIPSDNSSIASDAGRVWLTWASYSSIEKEDIYVIVGNPSGDPSANEYYEYNGTEFILSIDTSVVQDKVYYYVIKDEAIHVKDATFINRSSDSSDTSQFLQPMDFNYYGNIVWIQKEGFTYNGVKAKRFFIPLCYREKNDEGGYYNNNIVFRRDKRSYNSFLSARTYYNLLDELSDKFVHRSGGKTLGDIGYLNVTGATIKRHDYDDFEHVVSINRLHLTGIPVKENTNADKTRQYVSNMLILGGTGENNNDPDREGYKRGRIYRTSDNWLIGISHGGTGAIDRDEARKNLHFYYGRNIPTDSETKGKESGYYYIKPTKVDKTTLDYGAVWFRIL